MIALVVGAGTASAAVCGGGGTFTISANVITRSSGCVGDVPIPETVTSVEANAFSGAVRVTSVTFLGTSSVGTIGANAFYGTSVTSIALPASLTTIGDSAFFRTGLTSIGVPSTVTSLGTNAFNGTSLVTIAVDDANPNYMDIDGVLFNKGGTALLGYPAARRTTYAMPGTVRTIDDYAFSGTGLTGIVLSGDLMTIGLSAFKGAANLTGIVIPGTVTTIGDEAFSGTSALRTVTFAHPSALTSIGEYAFYGSGLVGIDIPSSVTSIDNDAFDSATQLERVTFEPPSRLARIEGWLFYNAASLVSITLPSTVTSIGTQAFRRASKLASVYFENSAAPRIVGGAFDGVAAGATAYRLPEATGFAPLASTFYGLIVAEYLPAPQAPVAVAGVESATITVVPAAVGPVASSYVVAASPGGATCTVSGGDDACAIAGLTAGTAYTFTAVAHTSSPDLTSLASAASAAVLPTAPVVPEASATSEAPAASAATQAVPPSLFSQGDAPKQMPGGLVFTILASQSGVVDVRVTTAGARSLQAAPRVLCSARQRIRRAGRITVVCVYTNTARKLLGRGAVQATQTMTFRPRTGAATVATTALRLRRLHPQAPSRVTG